MFKRISVQHDDFDVAAEMAMLRERDPRVGAVAVFIGTVREMNDAANGSASVQTMTLEHYPGMTEKALAKIVAEAAQRFDILGATVIHRIGELKPLDQIVLVAVKSAHRGDAFDACRFIMDYLKTQAPFWKKETTSQGAHWVDARESDDEAAARWQRPCAGGG
ncbi:MAG: molybdopterin synthase catalytic subunit MoaE [Proteobacteria bacterium]|nr:molybdopterin synthase catalytic subunit MoaE [Pseudomonadota bacterium]MCL2307575.1 molybdopterin synthase catalytic subunit MoaE [Pseudomonadota bacterium]